MRAYYVAPIPPLHIISGAAFNTFTTYQSISPAPDIKLPANILEPGTQIELKARGQFSNTATPTLSIGFFIGTAATIPIGQSAAITTTTGATAWPWQIEYEGRVRAVGTAAIGTIEGQGRIDLGTSLTAMTSQFTPTTLALRTVLFDTTIEKVVGVGAAWGTSSVSNTITTTFFSVQIVS